jgi:hypothetical protein
MADSPRTLSPAVSTTPYRPVSAMAVAGFGVAVMAVLVIGGMAVVSLWTGKPTLSAVGVIVAALGFALSLAGFLHVRAAEGTRAGGGLAKAGLALSALFGLGYAAFAFSMEAAVRLQAQRFTNEWLEKVRQGQYEEAMRLTLRPDMRENLKPADVRARFNDQLEQLRDGDLARAFRNWLGAVTIEPAGIKEWGYEEGAYRVYENYRIGTPEGPYEAAITVSGTEGVEGGGRQWQVLLGKTGARQSGYTKLGLLMNESKGEMQGFARAWVAKLSRGELADALLMTLDPAERPKLAGNKSPLGLADFPGTLIKVDGKPPTDEQRKKYAAAVQSGAINLAPGANPIRAAPPPNPSWGPDGLSYVLTVQITPPGESAVFALLTVAVVGPELQQDMLRLKGPGWEQEPLVKVDESYFTGREIKPYHHNYRVTEVDVRPEEAKAQDGK